MNKINTAFLLLSLSCASPHPTGDAAAPNDATLPPADAQSSVRPARYPDRSLVTCSRWIMHRMTVPPPLDGCRPWVGFVGPHNREMTRQLVAASACGHSIIVDPTQATQRGPISWIPDGQSFVRSGLSIVYSASWQFDNDLSMTSHLQLGNGLQPAQFTTFNRMLVVRDVAGMNSMNTLRLPDPRTHIVAFNRYPRADITGVSSTLVVEIPEAQMDGTFRVRRFLRGGITFDAARELAPIVRRTNVPQIEGTSTRALDGSPPPVITCAAADGKLHIELSGPNNYYHSFPAYDTGDPTLQRCSLSNVNGTILLVASSDTGSIALTLDVRQMNLRPMVEFIPFAQQPNFLPVDRAQLGRDEGPFDVTVAATLDNAPATLVLYTRRAMAGAADVPTFAFVDRLFDYESTPESPQFIPSPTPTVGAMYAAAFWPTGQVAFARFDPRTGVLDASTAQCDR